MDFFAPAEQLMLENIPNRYQEELLFEVSPLICQMVTRGPWPSPTITLNHTGGTVNERSAGPAKRIETIQL